MSWVVKIGWIAGVGGVTVLIFWAGAGPVLHAFETAGWGVFAVVLLRGTAGGRGRLWGVVPFPPAPPPHRFPRRVPPLPPGGPPTPLPTSQHARGRLPGPAPAS